MLGLVPPKPLAFLAAAGLCLVSALAFAKDKPTIGVVGVHQSGLTLEAQTAAVDKIVQVIDRSGRFEAVGPNAVAFQMQGREDIVIDESFLGPGRRLLEDGRILHDQAQPEEAIPVLQEAIDNLRLGMAATDSTQDLWVAWTYLGTAHLTLEQADEATAAYRSAVALNPDRLPDPSQFPPSVIEFFKGVQTERVALAGKVQISADQPNVVVFVNGREVGNAPVTVDRVIPGENHVVAKGELLRSYQLIEVPQNANMKVEMALSFATLGTSAESRFARTRQTSGLYRALARHADLDLVLLAGEAEDKLAVQLYSKLNDAFSKPLEMATSDEPGGPIADKLKELLQVATDEGAISSLATATNAVPLGVADNGALTQMLVNPTEVAPPPPGVRWWLVAAGAGGAAVLAGGAVALIVGTTRTEPLQGTITVGPVP